MNDFEAMKNIRSRFASKGDVIFRTAIQCVVECGQQSFNDHEWYDKMIKNIDERHDQAEAEGKWLIMTREFEYAILECAGEIANLNAYEVLMYIQKEVWLGGKVGELAYQEAIECLKSAMRYIEDDKCSIADTLDAFYDIGLEDDQIDYLGFGHLLDTEE